MSYYLSSSVMVIYGTNAVIHLPQSLTREEIDPLARRIEEFHERLWYE